MLSPEQRKKLVGILQGSGFDEKKPSPRRRRVEEIHFKMLPPGVKSVPLPPAPDMPATRSARAAILRRAQDEVRRRRMDTVDLSPPRGGRTTPGSVVH